MANYVSSTMATGPKLKETLGKIDNYSPDSYSWTEISSSITVNLTNPTATSGITSPGDYVIYKFTNGPSAIPTTLSPILLSLRSSGIYVSAKDAVYSYTSSTWKDVSEIVEDTTILYIKSNTAPSRTSNTFWFDTSKYASNGYVDLKFYDTTSKAWISIFNDTNYLKKSSIDPNNKATDIFKYITDKVTATTGQYATFLKHKNNELTYVHVTADERTRYAKIITQSELDNLLENTYKSQIQSSINTAISNNLGVTQITSDTDTLQTSFNSHKTGHVTAANITAWNNKADANHTHAYTDGTVTINGSQVVAGVFTDSQLPNEMKERYYKITAASVAAEFGNTSLTDTDRKGKYHNGNAFYFESTSGSTTTRTWYRIIDQTKIGTSSWASGVTDFTAKVIEMSWANITGKPTTFSGYGITNDLYTKTQVDNKISTINASITEAENKLSALTENVSYDYTVDKEHPNFTPTWSTGTLPESTSHEWESICAGRNNDCVIVGTGSSAIRLINNEEQRVVDLPFYGEWTSVAYGNGKYVAIAYGSDKAAYSTDGENWIATTIPNNNKWWDVCYGNGKFVAVAGYINGANIAAYSTDGISWSSATLPSTAHWKSVCYGNGKFIAVAFNSNTAAYTVDGISWTATTLPRSLPWSSVCYGNGKFVAVASDTNYAAYSTDGINWTETTMPSSATWQSVCYGDGVFLASSGSTSAYSIDGKSWKSTSIGLGTQCTSICYNGKLVAISSSKISTASFYPNDISWSSTTIPNSVQWWDVCYGNGKYVAVTYSNSNIAAYSTDGINWTATTIPSGYSEKYVCYGNGKFVCVMENSYAAYSTDGINWTAATMPDYDSWSSGNWASVCYGNGKFVAISGGGVDSNKAAYSTDGINWTAATMSNNINWYHVCYGNGKYVAVAVNTNIAAYSTDGINWTAATMPSSVQWWYVCYGNGKFVAIADASNKAAYSTDGINWTAATMPDYDSWSSGNWASVCYGNGKFVAISGGGVDSNKAAYSTDGINWTAATMSSSNNWYSVCYGNGRFIAVGITSNIAVYSTYTSFNSSFELSDYTNNIMWDSVCYGNDKYVAIGYTDTGSSYVVYSSDGNSWASTNLDSSVTWRSVCYGNGKFVAIGYNSSGSETYTAYSTDGSSWTSSSTSSATGIWVSICYGSNKYVAIASNSNSALYSSDGTSWNKSTLPATAEWKCVCYGNNRFVAIASYTNKAAYSTNGSSWTETTLPSDAEWCSICYDESKFVAIAKDTNSIAYSTDSINWKSDYQLPNPQYNCICYGNGTFIITKNNSASMLYSTNLSDWEPINLPSKEFWSSIYYNDSSNEFLILGHYLENTLRIQMAYNNPFFNIDRIGIQMNTGSISNYTDMMTGVTPNIDVIIKTTDGKIYKTTNNNNSSYQKPDGTVITTTDSKEPIGASMLEFYVPISDSAASTAALVDNEDINGIDLAYLESINTLVATTVNGPYYSTDGINWTKSSNCNLEFSCICTGNDKFVGIVKNSNIAYYSTNGINWTASTICDTSYPWASICYGNGKFVAISVNFTKDTVIVAYSTDAINWTTTTFANDSGNSYVSIVYHTNISKYVMITEGSLNSSQEQIQVATSTDAISWDITSISSTIGYYEKIFTMNDNLYVIGQNGLLSSSDGTFWETNTLNWSRQEDKNRYNSNPITYYENSNVDQYFCTRMLYKYNNDLLTIFHKPNGGYVLAKSIDMINWESVYTFGPNVIPKDMIYANDNMIIIGDSRIV